VKKATNPAFSGIKKSQVLTAIDHLISPGLILRPSNQIPKMFQIIRTFHHFVKKPCSPSQPADKRFPPTVGIVVKATAGATGFAEIRLTQIDKRDIGFSLFGLHK